MHHQHQVLKQVMFLLRLHTTQVNFLVQPFNLLKSKTDFIQGVGPGGNPNPNYRPPPPNGGGGGNPGYPVQQGGGGGYPRQQGYGGGNSGGGGAGHTTVVVQQPQV